MVSIKSLAVSTLAAAAVAQARIVNFYAPSTACAGQNITVQLTSENYIQNWDSFGAIFGLDNPDLNCGGCLGQEIGYENLYGTFWHGNKSFPVAIPESANGTYALKVGIPYLVGASGSTHIQYFNSSITIQ